MEAWRLTMEPWRICIRVCQWWQICINLMRSRIRIRIHTEVEKLDHHNAWKWKDESKSILKWCESATLYRYASTNKESIWRLTLHKYLKFVSPDGMWGFITRSITILVLWSWDKPAKSFCTQNHLVLHKNIRIRTEWPEVKKGNKIIMLPSTNHTVTISRDGTTSNQEGKNCYRVFNTFNRFLVQNSK